MKKLHLGCFDQVHKGWVNTDITPHIWIAKVPFLPEILHKLGYLTAQRLKQHKQGIFRQIRRLDLTKRFPYANGEFAAAFSSHVIEHLYYNEAVSTLKEVHRVLMPGGIFRVAVPDLDRCVAEYDSTHPDNFCSAVFESKQARDKNQHHWMYNETSMGKLLHDVGFREVYRCKYQQGKSPDVDKIDNRPESLFMEAVK